MDKTQYAVPSQLPTSAATIQSDYDAKTDAYTGLPAQPFKAGGLAGIPRYNGEEESQVQTWDPASGQVKLQQFDPQDLSVSKTADYTIPKDDIQTFIPDMDTETGLPSGSGSYILNNGSKMMVDNTGTVIGATPGRDEYTLNKDGYYQPTGSGLTWDGNAGMLTKKIGGIDVQVPGMYTKGGYQDAQGGLRLDQYGTPIPLPPAQYDSGAGKSGLSDAAPYIAAAAMLAATGMPTGFEGMVPASETLMGSLGAYGTTAGAMGPTYGELGITGLEAGQMGPTYAEMGYTGLNQGEAIAAADAAAKSGYGLKDAYKAYKYANQAKNVLGALTGGKESSGLGNAPSASGYNAFDPGVRNAGLPISSGYEKTPWSNMMPQISLSKLSDFAPTREMAAGGMTGLGHLGGYSDGGRLLKGPGDGMSDNIPASISGKQPARLADGEFVVPADVVSHLGNGSTDAGAKQLYAMMDKIRTARTGNKKQGKQIKPSKFLPKG
jgi:hypothetical protein